MSGICFLYTWKQHSHCLNSNLSLNHGLDRHVHVLYVLPFCKKYLPTYWLLGTPGICRRYDFVVSCGVVAVTTFLLFSVFKIHACHRDEGFVILAGIFAGFTGWCLSTTSSVSGGGSHIGMTFSFQWITTEFFLWNPMYTDTLSATPFYDLTAIKLYSLILCVFYPKHYSYQHPSYLGVLDMCLISSLYLHCTYLCIVSICMFQVSLSLILLVCIFTYNLYVLLLSVGFMYHYSLILFICIFI